MSNSKTIVKKGLSLKKEISLNIKEELLKDGIPNFSELGIKRVNRGVKNISNSVNTTIVKRAGRKLKEMNTSEFLDIKDLQLAKNIYTNEEEFATIKRVLVNDTNFKGNISDDEIYVGVLVDILGNESEFATIISNDPTVNIELKHEGLYSFRTTTFKRHVLSYSTLKGLTYLFKSIGDYVTSQDHINNIVLELARKSSHRVTETKIIIPDNDLDYVEELIQGYKVFNGVNFDNLYKSGDYILNPHNLFVLESEVDESLASFYYMHLDELFNNEFLQYQRVFSRYVSKEPAILSFKPRSLFLLIYDMIADKNEAQEESSKQYVNLNRGYAKSFETKKHIPLYIKEIMDKSKFKTHFNYVEYDESVDVEKIDELEDDWTKLKDKINLPLLEGNDLRFRRLGHHKAAGLYYPQFKTLCVDINTTTSFIHEYMHMMDYCFSNNDRKQSSLFEFNIIKDKYIAESKKILNELPDEVYANYTSGKYNLSYFFSSEEIFARCGEMFLENNGVNTHLLGSKIGSTPFYPENDELFSLINNFYEKYNILI